MSYIVQIRNPKNWGDKVMVVNKQNRASFHDTPRKFMSKEAARDVAAEWAQHYADGGRLDYAVSVKKV